MFLEADLNDESTEFEDRNGQIFISQVDHDGRFERGPYDVVINCLGFKVGLFVGLFVCRFIH